MFDIAKVIEKECEVIENSLIKVLDNRPRYLKWIPKKYYTRHFLEIHRDNRPLISQNKIDWGYKISGTVTYKIYDKLRKKFV